MVSGWLSEALRSMAALLVLEWRRPFIMLMDGRPVFNVTCYDHINLSSVLIDITLLPLRLSQSINPHCKFRLETAATLHKPTISLPLPPSVLSFLSRTFLFCLAFCSLFNPPWFPLSSWYLSFLYLLSFSPHLLTGGRQTAWTKEWRNQTGIKM